MFPTFSIASSYALASSFGFPHIFFGIFIILGLKGVIPLLGGKILLFKPRADDPTMTGGSHLQIFPFALNAQKPTPVNKNEDTIRDENRATTQIWDSSHLFIFGWLYTSRIKQILILLADNIAATAKPTCGTIYPNSGIESKNSHSPTRDNNYTK